MAQGRGALDSCSGRSYPLTTITPIPPCPHPAESEPLMKTVFLRSRTKNKPQIKTSVFLAADSQDQPQGEAKPLYKAGTA